MTQIKIAVVGLGRIGWQFHCPTLQQHPQYDLVAVADADPARAAEGEQRFGCQGFTHYDDLLDVDGLEAVVIATPTHLHLEMARSAFGRGLHVYMEKPLAGDAAQSHQIVQLAESAGRVLGVYQPHRASATTQHLKAIIMSGLLGQVYRVRYGRFARYMRRSSASTAS